MISSINSLVSKVVSTVSGPLHTWGPKAVKAPKKAVASAKASKKSVKARKCKGGKCRKCKCS